MASITPMSFFTPDPSINPDEYTFEITDANARQQLSNSVLKFGYKTSGSFNDVVVPGIYYLQNLSDGPNITGYTSYILIVGGLNIQGTSAIKQIALPVSASGQMYERWKGQGSTWNAWVKSTYIDAATTSGKGLMSAADKTKLDGIATGANKGVAVGPNAESAYVDAYSNTTTWIRIWATRTADSTARGIIASSTGIFAYDLTNSQTLGNAIKWGAVPVSFSRSLTSGTKIGAITIDGSSTDLYCNAKAGVFTQEISIGTINASSNAGSEVALSGLPSGKTAIGTAGFLITGTNVTGIAVTKCWCDGSKIHYMLRNTFGTAATGVKLDVKVLYI